MTSLPTQQTAMFASIVIVAFLCQAAGADADAALPRVEPSGALAGPVALEPRHLPASPVLELSGFLGGMGWEGVTDVGLDAAGNMYIAGQTGSGDFPVTPNAFDKVLGGEGEGFVIRINSTGTKVDYATYVGGAGGDSVESMQVDDAGYAYITGGTTSPEFPVTADAFDGTHAGGYDVYMAVVSPNGSSLSYSTFIGGIGEDFARSIALDDSGSVYLAGSTRSPEFPTTPGAYERVHSGGLDMFALKLRPGDLSLTFSTFIHGGSNEDVAELVLAAGGDVVITALNQSSCCATYLPAAGVSGAAPCAPAKQISVIRLDSTASSLRNWACIGGSGEEFLASASAAADGSVLLAGGTYSADFPTTPGAYDTSLQGRDGFAMRVSPTGTIVSSTFLGGGTGGNDQDAAMSIIELGDGSVLVGGIAFTDDFPTTPDAFDRVKNGIADAFILQLSAPATSLQYSTLAGGSSGDEDHEGATALLEDLQGNWYVGGNAISRDFPVTPGAWDTQYAYGDGFLMKLRTGQPVPPQVYYTVPTNGETSVLTNATVQVVFTQSMEPLSTAASFSISPLVQGTATVSGAVMTWAHQPFALGTLYTVSIEQNATSTAGVKLGQPYAFSFQTVNITPPARPTVMATIPKDGTSSVAVDNVLSVEFDREMEPVSTAGAFSISPTVQGTATVSGAVVTWSHMPLAISTTYTVTIEKTATSIAGVELGQPYAFSFQTVDIVPPPRPTVLTTVPKDGTPSVALDIVVNVVFDRPMEPVSTAAAMRISPTVQGTPSVSDVVLSFSHLPFENDTIYTVTIDGNATSTLGSKLSQSYTFTFRTVAETAPLPPKVIEVSPRPGSTYVALDSPVIVRFDLPMAPDRTRASFQITPAVDQGSVDLSGTELKFTHTESFQPATLYEVRITTAAASENGVPLKEEYVFTFVTTGEGGTVPVPGTFGGVPLAAWAIVAAVVAGILATVAALLLARRKRAGKPRVRSDG